MSILETVKKENIESVLLKEKNNWNEIYLND